MLKWINQERGLINVLKTKCKFLYESYFYVHIFNLPISNLHFQIYGHLKHFLNGEYSIKDDKTKKLFKGKYY
jgi:hypothetical protein